MPAIHREGPYSFSFYSDDRREPPHIHVKRDRNEAKFWLDPVQLARNAGFRQTELNRMSRIIEQNEAMMLERWYAYFDQ